MPIATFTTLLTSLFGLQLLNPSIAAIGPTPAPVPAPSTNLWSLTVYYTAVEKFHGGKKIAVRGCLDMDCNKKGLIGNYPRDFIQAVKDEGTGRITSGVHAGKYLCWSKNEGYWLDSIPKDAQGTALIPWTSAAADSNVMVYGATFRVQDCGKDDTDGSDINPATCERIKSAHWKISDRFELGLGGSQHLDLYIGEEDQEDFTNTSPKVVSLKSAVISIDQASHTLQDEAEE